MQDLWFDRWPVLADPAVVFGMQWMREFLSWTFIVFGAVFFLGGTLGLIRFPDLLTRLHALTKADNLGLGCICLGLALRAESGSAAAKLIAVWGLALLASAVSAHLIARYAFQRAIRRPVSVAESPVANPSSHDTTEPPTRTPL